MRLVARVLRRPFRNLARRLRRQRFRDSVRSSDIFVVAYPKSGTTWVSYFLASIIADRARGYREELKLPEAEDWVPDVNSEYFGGRSLSKYDQLAEPRVFRVHAPCDRSFGRVVYVVRDPRDVIVSSYYDRLRKDAGFTDVIDRFVQANRMWPCDWGRHVSGWLGQAETQRVLLVRYEDLQRSAHRELRRVASFYGLHLSDDELDHYVERSSFDRMRIAEDRAEPKNARAIRFIRRGAVGDWRSELSADSVRLIEERYSAVMRELGYRTSFESAEGRRTPNAPEIVPRL